MDEHNDTQIGASELSAIQRRVQRLVGTTSKIQGRNARIDWRHDSAKDPVLTRIWAAAK